MTGIEFVNKLITATAISGDIVPAGKLLADIPKESHITRKQTAIIVHAFLKTVLKETDEKDTKKAQRLKDLYDCRICVKHIEQVYVKGIMMPFINEETAKENSLPILFGGNEPLTEDEADQIVNRTIHKQMRISVS